MMANLIAAQRHSGCSTTFKYKSEKMRAYPIAAQRQAASSVLSKIGVEKMRANLKAA